MRNKDVFIEKWPKDFAGRVRGILESFDKREITRAEAIKEVTDHFSIALNTVRPEREDE